MIRPIVAGTFAVLALGFNGCAPNYSVSGLAPLAEAVVAEDERQPRGRQGRQMRRAEANEAPGLSPRTLRTLRQRDLLGLWDVHPELVIRALDSLADETPKTDRHEGYEDLLSSLAELCLKEAERMDEVNSEAASSFYLYAASRAYRYLLAPVEPMNRAFDPTFGRMLEVYQEAAGGYLSLLFAQEQGAEGVVERGPFSDRTQGLRDRYHDVLGEGWRVRVERRGEVWHPRYFDELLLADGVQVVGLRNHYQRAGFGVPLVGIRDNRGGVRERYFPPTGIIFPVTAVLRFDIDAAPPSDEMGLFDDFVSTEDQHTAVISFHDPQHTPALSINKRRVPLAADFTAPYAMLLERSKLWRVAREGFSGAETAYDFQGLYMHAPYDPDKIPVLMIHGLRSSAHAWAEMTNDLNGDPELRRRYQFWHYVYPSALPYLYVSADLRAELEELRRLDPEGKHPAQRSMIIVAHSMGGLVSRPLVTTSGQTIWDAVVNVPPEEVRGNPEDLERIRQMMIFEPHPTIRRVVFISTPHRGSALANGLLRRMGNRIIDLPEEYTGLFQRMAVANEETLRPEVRKMMLEGGPSSVTALSDRHRVLLALSTLRTDPNVHAHTIIGDRDMVEAEGGDGVVTHESAHLPEATSELFVPARHNAASHPLTILEVKRILSEHLRENAGS